MLDRVEQFDWQNAFRNITGPTTERSLVSSSVGISAIGHSATKFETESRVLTSLLLVANLNSIPLDWATRIKLSGNNLSYFVMKQLPVLPPNAYLAQSNCLKTYVELVVPRSMTLSFTSSELRGLPVAMGIDIEPYEWSEDQRIRLKCELDAIFAHMYTLNRSDLTYILDPEFPGISFTRLIEEETKEYGEYRTKRLALEAFDQLTSGQEPNLQESAL